MLHSQLALIEDDPKLRPDLFDMKYLRDELYYYSRDENQFLRRRRTFLFCLYPSLIKARFKDSNLPVQRIVLVLSLLLVMVRKLSEWFSTEALTFEFLLIRDGENRPLTHEGGLLEMLFREHIENKVVAVEHFSGDLKSYAEQRASRSQCQLLNISADIVECELDVTFTADLVVPGPRPAVRIGLDELSELPANDDLECWAATLERLLANWV